jgi:hypothetical protein
MCTVRSCCFVFFGCSCLFDVGRVATNFIKISNLIVKKGMEKKTTKLVFPKQLKRSDRGSVRVTRRAIEIRTY